MAAGGVPQFASLYVGDLKPEVTEAMLYEIFNAVGPVASIRVCRDSVNRRSLGYGYINYHNVADGERALDTMNYSSIKGRSCRIMWSQRDPALRKSGAGNIYVKNLDKNIDNKALYDTFSLFGTILSCKVASDVNGNSYGYGFVHYESADAATQAIERVNGMKIGDETVQVCEFEKQKDITSVNKEIFTNLYVKNFPTDWTEARLNTMFAEFGAISSCALRSDNKQRPFAFVNFELPEDAKKAVDGLNKKDLRPAEETAAEKESGKEPEVDPEGNLVHALFVGRAQTKAERQAELRAKFTKEDTSDKKDNGVNLYVKNLDAETDDDALRALFEPFGELKSVSAPKDESGKCKGFGFACFTSPDDATKAVTELHLKVVNGKPLYVGLSEKREVREARLAAKSHAARGPMGGGKKGGKGKGFSGPAFPGQGGKGGAGFPGQGGKGGPMGPPMFGGSQQQQMQQMMMQQMKGGPQGGMGQFGGGPMPPMNMGGAKGAQMMANPQQQQMQQMQMMAMMSKGMGGMMPPVGPQVGPQMMGGMLGGKGGMLGGMMGPGPMGGPAPRQNMQQQQGQQQRPPMFGQRQGQPPAAPGGPLNASVLASAPPPVQKQMIGEKLFPAISKFEPGLAGKITGMMLEMENSELLMLLESDTMMKKKVDEAVRVLNK